MKSSKHLLFIWFITHIMLSIMTACSNNSPSVEVYGRFVFTCSDDLLLFFTPRLTYTSPDGDTTCLELTRENMSCKIYELTDTLNGESNTDSKFMVGYQYIIPISTNFLGFETSAEVKYNYNGNTDYSLADKLKHSLYGTISSITYRDGNGVTNTISNIDVTLDITIGTEPRKSIEEQIDEIQHSIDHFQLNVSRSGKITKKEWTDTIPHDDTDIYPFIGKTYVWKLEKPYIQDDHSSAWLDIEKKIHTPYKYELLTHTMAIRGIDDKRLDWEEKIDREYTSAYRYIGNEEQPIFLLHEDDWELFDTVYRMTEERNITMSYSIDYPSVSFKLNNIYMNATYGLFNYDYELFKWDSSCPLTGEFITTDTLQCNLSTLSNRKDTISIERTFINPN